MKSRRVTKLLACVLAASMCAVPVSATSRGGTLTSNVSLNNPTVTATFPTKLDLQVNPMADTTDTSSGISMNQEIASKELVIGNSTSKNGVYYDLLCTATAQATTVGQDVQLTYRTFTTDADSTTKKVFMEMVSANENGSNGGAASINNTYTSGTGTAVTKLKSQLQFTVPKASASSPTVSGAFAIIGKANANADWQASDLAVAVIYNVKAVKDNYTPRSIPTLASATTNSKLQVDNASSDFQLATATELSDSVLKDAEITHVQVHSPENVFADVLMEAKDERLTLDYTDTTDASNPPTWHSCAVSLTKDTTFLKNLANNQKGKTFDVVICLSDGRRLISKIAVDKGQS